MTQTVYLARTTDAKDTAEFDHAGDAFDHIKVVLEAIQPAFVWQIDLDAKGEPESIRDITEDMIGKEAERLFCDGSDTTDVPFYAREAFLRLADEQGYRVAAE